jgi:serine protease AprX
MISNNVARRSKILGLLTLLSCIVFVSSLSVPVSGQGSPVFMRLKAGSFDPLQALPALPEQLSYTPAQAAAAGVYIVQFTGPVMTEWKQAVVEAGGQLGDYLPDYAFLARLDSDAHKRVQALSFVRWVGPFEPAYKLSPGVDDDGARSYRLHLAPWADAQNALAALPVQAQTYHQGLVAVLDEAQVEQVAHLADVVWIEPLYLLRACNDVAGGDIMGGAAAWSNGYSADGVTVAVADTGLDTGNAATVHQDFYGRVTQARISSWPVVYANYGGGCETTNAGADDGAADLDSGHGTHVAGSVAGDGTRSAGQFRGLGYEATLTFQAVEQYTTWEDPSPYRCPNGYALTGIPYDVRSLLAEAYDWGARVHNDSWGGGDPGVYDLLAAQFDDFIYQNPDMTVVVAVGNDGADEDADGYVDEDSITSPGTAKNVIGVGASDNERSTGGYNPGGVCWTWGNCWSYPANPTRDDRLSDDREELAAFSSRGPLEDGRIKPDVVAPGTNILSVRSSQATGGGWWGLYDDYYMYMGGTSMASPLTAGAVALVRQYYIEGEAHANPSAALIKATLINSAVDIAGYGNASQEAGQPIPNNHEGWGRVDVAAATTPGFRQFEDDTQGVATSGTKTFDYDVQGAGQPFKVTLVWSDAPASASAAPALVNDLHLRVTAPDGVTHYWGNNFSGGWSQSYGNPDTANNVENVYVQSPSQGTWTVEVMGQNVPQGGAQPFALVVDSYMPPEELVVTGIQPSEAPNNAVLSDAVVSGGGFELTSMVYLVRDAVEIAGEDLTVDTEADTIHADFDLEGAAPGMWDVRVNNSSAASATLEGAFNVLDATLPDLTISKTAHRSLVAPGSWLTYSIVISNAGYVSATDILFTDTLPVGVTFERLTPLCIGGTAALSGTHGFACRVQAGSLLVEEGIRYTLVVSVGEGVSGTLTNQVVVGSAEADARPGNNSAQASVWVRGSEAVYVPLVLKFWPPLPGAPVLSPIDNADWNGIYMVSWEAAPGPETTAYDLEENGEIIQSDYAFTSYYAWGRDPGTYTYRVRGKNGYSVGPWSDPQSVTVLPPFTFESVADTYVLEGYASTNYGDEGKMWVGYDELLDPDGETARGFVQFDLSEIPASTSIREATLYLRLENSYDFEGQSRTITVYRLGTSWSETGVNWNSRPAIAEAYGSASVTHGRGPWYAFDVTALVQGWINDDWSNYGLAVRGPEHSGYDSSWKSFYTRESDSAPYIEVTYTAQPTRGGE